MYLQCHHGTIITVGFGLMSIVNSSGLCQHLAVVNSSALCQHLAVVHCCLFHTAENHCAHYLSVVSLNC